VHFNEVVEFGQTQKWLDFLWDNQTSDKSNVVEIFIILIILILEFSVMFKLCLVKYALFVLT
jgi:hypothetical protein